MGRLTNVEIMRKAGVRIFYESTVVATFVQKSVKYTWPNADRVSRSYRP